MKRFNKQIMIAIISLISIISCTYSQDVALNPITVSIEEKIDWVHNKHMEKIILSRDTMKKITLPYYNTSGITTNKTAVIRYDLGFTYTKNNQVVRSIKTSMCYNRYCNEFWIPVDATNLGLLVTIEFYENQTFDTKPLSVFPLISYNWEYYED